VSFRSDRRFARDHHPSSFPRPRGAFAHPSEEIFAGLLTLYGIEWIYEPVEFPLAWADGGVPSRAFRPDFYLPGRRLFVELTTLHQRLVTKKNQKVRALRELYPEVQIEVVYRAQFGEIAARHQLGSLLDEWAA
jgi:hypoxanthine phosphoribosyltransferase